MYGSPPSEMLLPTMLGSALKRVSHSACEITVTRGPLGCLPPAVNVAAEQHRRADVSLKKSAETRPDRSCSGKLPPV